MLELETYGGTALGRGWIQRVPPPEETTLHSVLAFIEGEFTDSPHSVLGDHLRRPGMRGELGSKRNTYIPSPTIYATWPVC